MMKTEGKEPLGFAKQVPVKIAVIGIGCTYPGAKTPLEFWENVLSRRQQFREMPDVRLPNGEYYDPDPSVPDKTYQNRAAVVENFNFDWIKHKIPKQTYESTDIAHWMAIDTVLKAIEDAGYKIGELPKETTGSIFGNTFMGEFTRSNMQRLRWPYVRKVLMASLQAKGLAHLFHQIEGTMESYYKSVFAPVTEDTLAGGLPNTIAGRVCNFLNVNGGGYIVDGACSSSLLAISTACNYLASDQMEVAIAGGVDISLDTFELIGFAKTGALAKKEMQVYDQKGNGFLPGEGCGVVVLKRLEDAQRDNDQIYAVINGWGVSSDGAGGITAPNAVGQSMALKRAYKRGNVNPAELDCIEGHGTGTTVGDKIELESISIALGDENLTPIRNTGITSLKSILGHTKAAAGIGALIKTVIALNQRVIPPTAGLEEMNQVFFTKAKKVFPVMHGEVLPPSKIMQAGVSAMGFGGINCHVALQSGETYYQKLTPATEVRKMLATKQWTEVFFFSADSADTLYDAINRSISESKGISYAELSDYAVHHNAHVQTGLPYAAAVVAKTPFDLQDKLKEALAACDQFEEGNNYSNATGTVIVSKRLKKPVLGAIFPGQGSQQLNAARMLVERFEWARQRVEQARSIFQEEGAENVLDKLFVYPEKALDQDTLKTWKNELTQTNIAQPAICLASMLWYEYLTRLGVTFSATTGHSLGELAAFAAAGHYSWTDALRFAVLRGKVMDETGSGTMASLVCTQNEAAELLDDVIEAVRIANINAPDQIVISGEAKSIRYVIEKAEKLNIGAVELKVSAAFHSHLMNDAVAVIRKIACLNASTSKSEMKLISTMTGKEVAEKTALNAYFADQVIHGVNFVKAIESISKTCDQLIEIGPGRVLSNLVKRIDAGVDCLPVESSEWKDEDYNKVLARLHTLGVELNIEELYSGRFVREFEPASNKEFIRNPLERPLKLGNGQTYTPPKGDELGSVMQQLGISMEEAGEYLSARGNFIKEVIRADMKYFGTGTPTALEPDTHHQPEAVTQQTASIVTDSVDIQIAVKKAIYAKIEEMTGFPESAIQPTSRLLDDLNLDSIKSGTLLVEVLKAFKVPGKLEPVKYSNASIDDLTQGIVEVVEAEAGKNASVITETISAEAKVKQHLFALIEEKTGFPVESIDENWKLLDDINLDSIKAGSLIAEISKAFGQQGKLEPVKFANASLVEIKNAILDLMGDTTASSSSKAQKASAEWVRSFVARFEPADLEPEANDLSIWKNKKVAVYAHPSFPAYADELCRNVAKLTATTELVDDKTVQSGAITSFDALIIAMPVIQQLTEESLPKLIDFYCSIAVSPYLMEGKTGQLAFIQWGNGLYYKTTPQQNVNNIVSAMSFASSVHLEHPDLKVRVVDFHGDTNLNNVAVQVLNELNTPFTFDVTGYNNATQRQRLYNDLVSAEAPQRKIDIQPNDVVLITGGAKGITAECGIAYAQKYKGKFALIGSSPLTNDSSDILKTIDGSKEQALDCRYYACDTSDKATMKATLAKIREDLGEIEVVIHGAGKNHPSRLELLTSKGVMNEVSPKLLGAIHLMDALEQRPPKLLAGITSILGITGMRGNSTYCLSNETLDMMIREFGSRHTKTQTVTMAYSIWDQVGMGVKMGSVDALSKLGIGSISPEEGTREFMRAIEKANPDQQVAITSNIYGIDTWRRILPKKPKANRFLEEVMVFEPGVELIVRAKLNIEKDRYLLDHNYNGSYLFPTVFGVEAMSQAVALLMGIDKLHAVRLENISLEKPIVVFGKGTTEIEIKALAANPLDNNQGIKVGISTENSDFSEDHFSATFYLDDVSLSEVETFETSNEALDVVPETDLYSWLLFQGELFRNIEKLYHVGNNVAEFSTIDNKQHYKQCYGNGLSEAFALGSPLVRDTLLQSGQLLFTDKRYLPVGIDSWTIVNGEYNIDQREKVKCSLTEKNGDDAKCRVLALTENNLPAELIEGYKVRALESTPGLPAPEQIANMQTIYQKVFSDELSKYKQYLPDDGLTTQIYRVGSIASKDKEMRHLIEDELVKAELKHSSNCIIKGLFNDRIHLSWDENGKPGLSGIDEKDCKISISHSDNFMLMTYGQQQQGCDIEILTERDADTWQALLNSKIYQTAAYLIQDGENLHLAGTRLWSLKEVMFKATGETELNIRLYQKDQQAVVFKVLQGDLVYNVLTLPVKLMQQKPHVVAILTTVEPASSLKTASARSVGKNEHK